MISANVKLWGRRIGVVVQENLESIPVFNYAPEFLASGIQPSPITMPLSPAAYSFPALEGGSFFALPGLLSDSLPDKFGNAVLESYLARSSRGLADISAVERLLYIGSRGMGALEYEPAKEMSSYDAQLDIEVLSVTANEILKSREDFKSSISQEGLESIFSIGTSAGGARAKAVVALNEATGEIRSGQVEAKAGFEHWIVKFDGITKNKDKGETYDPPAYTRIEYAYNLMAKDAGIDINESRLYKAGDNYHFMAKRFDRQGDAKIHMQTLGALAHLDYNQPAACGYEFAGLVMRQLGLSAEAMEELFRRMVFNVLANNHDDHVKNLSFLMNRKGTWSLAPAYDVTFACDPANYWLRGHQMSINEKTTDISSDDILACAKSLDISVRKANTIVEQVKTSISNWEKYAQQAYVPKKIMLGIKRSLI
ncbi:MAG: type II toxin-antitoxin system HipA family toxin [Enterococcus sp.]|nr:type II toxin-antitoxin system HipA family toxin [Enterococcus sp.]